MLAAEHNKDDVDTVKFAKKRRVEENNFEGSSHHGRRGKSCADTNDYVTYAFFSQRSIQLLSFCNPSYQKGNKSDPATTVFMIYCNQLCL